jgi:hypothetical protein
MHVQGPLTDDDRYHLIVNDWYGRLIRILNEDKIDASTRIIRVLVEAEEGFNPHTDLDTGSLRFGAPEEVNFAKGSQLMKTEEQGKDHILVFEGSVCQSRSAIWAVFRNYTCITTV